MSDHFDYGPLRDTAIGLVEQFGKQVQCSILRNVAMTPDDPDKPWRGANPTVKEFKFSAVALTKHFAEEGGGGRQDKKVIAPGSLVETAAEGDPATLCGMPVETDRVKIDGVEYGILGIQDVTPDDKTMIIKMDCRAWPLTTRQPQTPF